MNLWDASRRFCPFSHTVSVFENRVLASAAESATQEILSVGLSQWLCWIKFLLQSLVCHGLRVPLILVSSGSCFDFIVILS